LRRLRDEFGISLIYITHDLATAFQICNDIIVLYRGRLAEAGNAFKVVREPQHPYTQLLVGSIPRPDPDRAWPQEPDPAGLAAQADPKQGCPFAVRCPHTFEPCLQTAPPLYRTSPDQAATCYLHQESPALPLAEMDQLLLKGGAYQTS
jgi:peptide/nickel transport system ATP-binding protein